MPAAFEKGQTVLEEGADITHAYVIRTGWAIRYKMLEDGRRQVLNILLPGDVFDLQVLVRKHADHSVEAITDCDVTRVDASAFGHLFYESGALGLALWWAAIQEEAILREQIVRNGRRSGEERVVHLLLELRRRCLIIDEAKDAWLRLPMTQEIIADTLGLTNVYVNRLLRKLERNDLIARGPGWMDMRDLPKLRDIAGFDPAYLMMQAPDRMSPTDYE